MDVAFFEQFRQRVRRESFFPIRAVVRHDDELSKRFRKRVFPKDFFFVATADHDRHLPLRRFLCGKEHRRNPDAAADCDRMPDRFRKRATKRPRAIDHISHVERREPFCPDAYDAVIYRQKSTPGICPRDGNRTTQQMRGVSYFDMNELPRRRRFCDARQFHLHPPNGRPHQVMTADETFFDECFHSYCSFT